MTHDEHDSELDQRRRLASAYIDGGLTAVERAGAEGDAEVMNEVAAMRDVRRQLAVQEAPDAAQREAAIRAALGAGGTAVAAPPPPSALARRRARWLAPLAAAAAVVAVVGGVVALRSTDDGGDDDSSADVAAQLEADDEALSAEGESAPRDTVPTAAAPAGTERTESSAAAAATTAAEAAEDAAAETTQDAGAAAGPIVLRSPEDLLAFASAPPAGRESAVSLLVCPGGRFIGTASYIGLDTIRRDVEVYIDEENGEVLAIDVASCEVVLRASPR